MADIKKLSMEELEQQLAAKNKNIEQISRKLELLSSLTPKRILGETTFDKQSVDLVESDLQISMQTKSSNDSDKTSNLQQSSQLPLNVPTKREVRKDSLNISSRNKNYLNTSNNGESSDAVLKAMKALQQKISELESENSLLQQHLHKRDIQYSTELNQFRDKIQTEMDLQNEYKLKIMELEKLCKHFETEFNKKEVKFQKLQNELKETQLKVAVANEEKKIIQNEKERHLEEEQREWEKMEQERLKLKDNKTNLTQKLVDTQLELKEALKEKQKLLDQNQVLKNKISKQCTQTRQEPSPSIKELIEIFSRLVEFIKPELNKFGNRSELNSMIIKGNKTINQILLKQQSGGLKENTRILNKCPPSGRLKQTEKQADKHKFLRSNSMNRTKIALQNNQQSPTSAFSLSVLDLENSKVKETKKFKKLQQKNDFDNSSFIKLNTLNVIQNNSLNLLNSRVTGQTQYCNEIEISEEIWKEERSIVQLKKEVRSLMNQSQSTINNEKFCVELEQTNQTLQQKTEYLTHLRQQQKELIAKALVK